MRLTHPTLPPLAHLSLFFLKASQEISYTQAFSINTSNINRNNYQRTTSSAPRFAKHNKQQNILQDFLPQVFSTADVPTTEGEVPKKSKTEEKLEALNIQASITPKPFSVAPEVALDVIAASFPTIFRLASGTFGHNYKISIQRTDGIPNKMYSLASFQTWQIKEDCDRNFDKLPIVLYEFEGCPFCRKVREAASILSLDVTFMPCPQNGRIYRREIQEKYGNGGESSKVTFPFMRDPNTGVEMFESDDIIRYLFTCYGSGGPNTEIPYMLRPGLVPSTLTAGLATLSRFGRGVKALPSTKPPLPLILWSYEGSPFCKIVREYLCELELAHTQMSCPRGSPNRDKLFEMAGRFQVPYLQDPNEGIELFESAAILEYLEKKYRIQPSPVDYI